MPRKKVIAPTPAANTSPVSAALEGKPRDTKLGNDIDARMAALLKDHQAMGARPKSEPAGDTNESTYPLKDKAAKK